MAEQAVNAFACCAAFALVSACEALVTLCKAILPRDLNKRKICVLFSDLQPTLPSTWLCHGTGRCRSWCSFTAAACICPFKLAVVARVCCKAPPRPRVRCSMHPGHTAARVLPMLRAVRACTLRAALLRGHNGGQGCPSLASTRNRWIACPACIHRQCAVVLWAPQQRCQSLACFALTMLASILNCHAAADVSPDAGNLCSLPINDSPTRSKSFAVVHAPPCKNHTWSQAWQIAICGGLEAIEYPGASLCGQRPHR